jgi:hypothetical protein
MSTVKYIGRPQAIALDVDSVKLLENFWVTNHQPLKDLHIRYKDSQLGVPANRQVLLADWQGPMTEIEQSMKLGVVSTAKSFKSVSIVGITFRTHSSERGMSTKDSQLRYRYTDADDVGQVGVGRIEGIYLVRAYDHPNAPTAGVLYLRNYNQLDARIANVIARIKCPFDRVQLSPTHLFCNLSDISPMNINLLPSPVVHTDMVLVDRDRQYR